MIETMVQKVLSLFKLQLDERGMSKQEALLALAVVSAWIIQREPHHVQDDLDDFISDAIQALLEKA